MAKRKGTNKDLQNMHKTKDRVTRTPLKTGDKLRCSGRVSSSCSTSGTRRQPLQEKFYKAKQDCFWALGTG
jgi:hypothetical protein